MHARMNAYSCMQSTPRLDLAVCSAGAGIGDDGVPSGTFAFESRNAAASLDFIDDAGVPSIRFFFFLFFVSFSFFFLFLLLSFCRFFSSFFVSFSFFFFRFFFFLFVSFLFFYSAYCWFVVSLRLGLKGRGRS